VLEGDAEDAPPDRAVAVADAGGVVRHQPELELRDEVEKLAEEEAGRHGVAAGQMLDEPFGEALPVRHLDRDDEPGAGEGRDVVRNPAIAFLLEKRLEVRGARVVAEGRLDRLGERGLSAGFGSEQEEEDFFAGCR